MMTLAHLHNISRRSGAPVADSHYRDNNFITDTRPHRAHIIRTRSAVIRMANAVPHQPYVVLVLFFSYFRLPFPRLC
jgi:hypothetical protein